MKLQIFVIFSSSLLAPIVSGAIITDAIKGTGSEENTKKRASGEGCYDDYGRHYAVGQRWRVNGGYCACYRFGTIGCVGEPVTAAPLPNKRSLEEGCHDDNGKHYSVGERWREDFGSCQCYEDGSIGCVGEPLVFPPLTMPAPIKRATPEGCHDDEGNHHAVGEGWKIDGGFCRCYDGGNIGCVGEPVTVPPRVTIALPDKISLPEGCHDADGVHHAVGEGWKVDSGYCKCYERGNIWCVADPVHAPPQHECTYKGKTYPPGKYFFDGCIRCFCDGRKGEHVCTTYYCHN